MRKRIFRGAIYFILALSIPVISWSIKENGPELGRNVRRDTLEHPATPVVVTPEETFEKYVSEIYATAGLGAYHLDREVFKKAITGYYNFKTSNLVSSDKQIISIVDFNKPSTEKRLWIIDLAAGKVLFNTFVAHGQGSGDNMATTFSNTSESHQSSLGFYITSGTYQGKHGLSLRLNGMDKGYNNNALNRAVVVHGADYVSQGFINQHGRLGRSYGCPAIPVELTPAIINAIKGRTALFINGPSSVNFASAYLDETTAAAHFDRGQLYAGNAI